MMRPRGIAGEFGERFDQAGALHFQFAQVRVGSEQSAHHGFGLGGRDVQTFVFPSHLIDFGPAADRIERQGAEATDAFQRHPRTQLIDRAFVDHPPARHHADAIGQRLGLFQVMRGQQHRATFGNQLADRRPQLLPRLDVHAHGGLVQEQQFGPAAQRQRELHASLLAAGEFRVGPAEQIGDASQLGAFGQGPRRRVVTGGQPQQLAHAQGRRQLGVLQHHADAAACLDPLRVLPEQFDRAGVGTDQPQQQADRGALAGPVGAEQRKQLAALQLQLGTIQRNQLAIAFDSAAEAGDRVDRMRHGNPSFDAHPARRGPWSAVAGVSHRE